MDPFRKIAVFLLLPFLTFENWAHSSIWSAERGQFVYSGGTFIVREVAIVGAVALLLYLPTLRRFRRFLAVTSGILMVMCVIGAIISIFFPPGFLVVALLYTGVKLMAYWVSKYDVDEEQPQKPQEKYEGPSRPKKVAIAYANTGLAAKKRVDLYNPQNVYNDTRVFECDILPFSRRGVIAATAKLANGKYIGVIELCSTKLNLPDRVTARATQVENSPREALDAAFRRLARVNDLRWLTSEQLTRLLAVPVSGQ